MADRLNTTLFDFQGGFATDLAPQVRELNFLVRAENLIYETSGAVRKVGGATAINGTAITGGPDVTGLFDFWLSGTGGISTQRLVAMSGDSNLWSSSGGNFTSITGAAVLTANTIPVFAQARDLLTIWTSNNDTPLRWNQTGNVASLGGTPPVGRGMVFHVNRGWAWGTNANPSRLFFSSSTDIQDWTGADTGSIDIDPEDGDRIVGAASHKGRLIVFKGPNKGSIHQIAGTAPTGSDAFSRTLLVRGIALQTHNAIIEVGDDFWFMSERGCHSLAATEAFGNFAEADLTRFLKGYFRNSINRSRLDRVWGVNYAHKSASLWTMTATGNSENQEVLGLSYVRLREGGVQPFTWPGRGCISACMRVNPTTLLREPVFGTTDGFAMRQDVADRSIGGSTSYNFRVTSPQIILAAADSAGNPKGDQPVFLSDVYVRSRPVGNYNVTIDVTRDNNAAEQFTFNQGTTGAIWGTDVFGTGVFGGGVLQTVYASGGGLAGECRSVRLDIQQGGLNQDADIYEVGILHKPSAQSRESTL